MSLALCSCSNGLADQIVALGCDGEYRERKLSDEELRKVLANHEDWVRTYWDSGQSTSNAALRDSRKADLCGADLIGVDLTNADLRGANLSEAYARKGNP